MAKTRDENELGKFLVDRRRRLDAASLGYPMTRRRTPGLRREEVAQRANVSATWYTWLEQGRGGTPSADVLDRLSRALALNEVEREHLFLLAQNRPPEVRYREARAITPQLQRVLDALELSPALVRTSEWDIVGWNRAALSVFWNCAALPEGRRNLLYLLFCEPEFRLRIPHWDAVARAMVATFRAETARTGAGPAAKALIEELSRTCPDFAELWLDHDVSALGEGLKSIRHPSVGSIALEYSAFAVEGAPPLTMVVFNPASPKDKELVLSLLRNSGADILDGREASGTGRECDGTEER